MKHIDTIPKRFWAISLAYLAFLLPYTLGWSWNWWKFPVVAIGIVLVMRFGDPEHYAESLGLRFKPQIMAAALAVFFVTNFCFDKWAGPLLQQQGYEPARTSDALFWKLSVLCQAWNEEMLLRSFLLFSVAAVMPGIIGNVCVSAVFALGHPLYYAVVNPEVDFSARAVLTLFLFSLGSNALYYLTRSLLLPFAIHAGWNFNKFGDEWRNAHTKEPLGEIEGFGLVEGNPAVLLIALLLALISHAILALSRRLTGVRMLDR
jgi:membrane protease YdiL (CAAX protease family)